MNTCAYTDVYQHTHIHVDTHMYKVNTQSHTHKVICPKPRVVRCKVELLAKAAMGRKERTDDGVWLGQQRPCKVLGSQQWGLGT